MSSFSLSGGVEVLGFISPTDSLDTYAVIDPLYGVDGFRNVNLLSDLDLIPEPRRRAGMVVGVSGGTTYYKLNSSPWNYNFSDWSVFNTGGGSVSGDYLPLSGGTVTGNTVFTLGLSANTISATTYQNLPTDIRVTGGTYNNGTTTFTNNTGGTFNVNGFYTGETSYVNSLITGFGLSADTTTGDITIINTDPDQVVVLNNGTNINVMGTYPNFTIDVTGLTDFNTFTTGFTYSSNTFTILDNSGNTFDATFTDVTGLTVNGDLNITGTTYSNVISATTYQNLPITTDVFVTGGTYSAGTSTFTNNTGGTFNVTGFYTGETSYVNSLTTGVGLSADTTNGDITIINTDPDQVVTISGGTGILTGGTYPNFTIENTLPDQTVVLNDGTNISVTGTYPNFTIDVTGLTDNNTYTTGFTYQDNTFTISDSSGNTLNAAINSVTGLTVNGTLSATTISATTYQNLPITTDVFVTGGTYSAGTSIFTNNTGGTFNVTGFYTGGTDNNQYVTGFTYSSNTFTILDNSGNTFSTTIDTMTGLTVNGVLSATTYQNLPQYYAGVISGSTNWINNNDGSITLPNLQVALFSTPNFSGPLNLYDISSTTFVLNNEDTNYIGVDYNGGSPIYFLSNNDGLINDSDVILYLIVYRSNNFLHILEFGDYGSGLPNKLNDRVLMTDRFAHESGCILGLSGSTGIVTLSDGVVWNGVNREVMSAVTSNDGVFFQNYHVNGNWVYTTTASTLNNEFYDDGTNLVSATTGNYLVNWYFRGQEVNDHLYEVFGNNEYISVAAAELSLEPLLPELITSHAFIVGRIIVGVGQTTGFTQTTFVTPFVSTQVTNHQDLLGLQGGGPGEYYHLSSNEYNNLAYTNVDNNFNTDQTINGGLTAITISATTISGGTLYGNGSNLTGLNIYNLTGGTEGQIISKDSSSDYDYTWKYDNEVIQLQIISEGNTISDGFKGYRYIDKDLILHKITMLSNSAATVDFRVAYSGGTIGTTGLSGQSYNVDTTLSGWVTNLSGGTFIEFYVDTAGTINTTQGVVILTIDCYKKI